MLHVKQDFYQTVSSFTNGITAKSPVIKRLLNNYPQLINQMDEPFRYCVLEGLGSTTNIRESIDSLIDGGFDINRVNRFGKTILHQLIADSWEYQTEEGGVATCSRAARSPESKVDRLQIIEHLLIRGADMHAKDFQGNPPLFYLKPSDSALVQLFVDHGFGLLTLGAQGKTLEEVVQENNLENVRLKIDEIWDRYQKYRPEDHATTPLPFQQAVCSLMATYPRPENPFWQLPVELIFEIFENLLHSTVTTGWIKEEEEPVASGSGTSSL